jgi:beta-hydroxylase
VPAHHRAGAEHRLIKAAMFAELPPGSKLVRHRDPYAGSYRYHLGLDTPNDPACYINVDGENYYWRDGEPVMFDETYIHYAENSTQQNRIILFCDIERPMKYRWATAFNRWFSRTVLAAAGSPNDVGDKTGGPNRAFGRLYKIRLRGKELKAAQSHARYYLEKWLIFAGGDDLRADLKPGLGATHAGGVAPSMSHMAY